MDFTSIAPMTIEHYSDMLYAIAHCTSFEEAEKNMPEKLFVFIKKYMDEQKQTYEETIKQIKTYLNTIKTIKVYLAHDPSLHLKKRILQIFEDFGLGYVVEVLFDDSMLGGVKVSIDGKFFDHSLATQLNKRLAATA